jgi:hypothetical protein
VQAKLGALLMEMRPGLMLTLMQQNMLPTPPSPGRGDSRPRSCLVNDLLPPVVVSALPCCQRMLVAGRGSRLLQARRTHVAWILQERLVLTQLQRQSIMAAWALYQERLEGVRAACKDSVECLEGQAAVEPHLSAHTAAQARARLLPSCGGLPALAVAVPTVPPQPPHSSIRGCCRAAQDYLASFEAAGALAVLLPAEAVAGMQLGFQVLVQVCWRSTPAQALGASVTAPQLPRA